MSRTKYKSIILLSGGIDSTVTLGKVIDMKGADDILCLIIDYKQKTLNSELFSAKRICAHYQVDYRIIKIDLPWRLNDKDALLPGRNTAFLAVACAFAESVGAKTVYIGANYDDHKVYADCRAKYFDHYNELLSLSDMQVQVHALFISLSKPGVISMGMELDVPLDMTWSCYNEGDFPCDECDACLLREESFKKAVTYLEDKSAI